MSKNPLEAFSDGVFAIAITLLVLEIGVPEGDHLWSELDLLMGISFGSMWIYITRHRRLLAVDLNDEEIRSLTKRFTLGNPFYALAIAVSFISPAAVLVIIALLAVYYSVAGIRSPITGD